MRYLFVASSLKMDFRPSFRWLPLHTTNLHHRYFFASGLVTITKVGALVSAVQRLQILKSIVITFAITLRFFLTAKEE